MKKVTISFEDMLAKIQSNYINKIKLIFFSLFRQIMAMKKNLIKMPSDLQTTDIQNLANTRILQ